MNEDTAERLLADLPGFVHRLSDNGLASLLKEASRERTPVWKQIADIVLDEINNRLTTTNDLLR
jgi:hypothetical protein